MSSSQRTLRDVMMQEERPTTMASRLLAPDVSLSNPSFRNYYGAASAGSVPFLWESAPGTPKNDGISSRALPPITPPPSYYSKIIAKSQSSKKLLSSSKPASFVPTMFRRSHTMPPPSASKESVQYSRRKRLVASPPRSSFSSNSRGEDEDADGGAGSPTSTLCFRARRSGGGTGRLHGLLGSVVGR